MADVPMVDAPGSMAEAARNSIHANFVAKFGPPGNQVGRDLLEAYIEELVRLNNGQPHTDEQIEELKRHVVAASQMVEKITHY